MRQEDYPPGTIVFAKLKGYPWWPARVEDDKSIPSKVLKQRANKTKGPLWTVFFFGSRDYGFFGPDAIRPFNSENVERDLKAKKFKTKDLENAVRQALDPSLLEKEEQEDEDEDDDDEQSEEEQAAKKPRRTRTARKNASDTKKKTATGGRRAKKAKEDEEEDDSEPSNKVKRRSRKLDDADKDMHDATDRKKRRKSISTDKEERRASPVANRDNTASSDDKPKVEDDPAYKEKKERMYMMRHRLQKLVYQKKPGEIPKDSYQTISKLLKSVEDSHMTHRLFKDTKIGQVIKAAAVYPYEDDTEYNIQKRCRQLMASWRDIFRNEAENNGKAAAEDKPATTETSVNHEQKDTNQRVSLPATQEIKPQPMAVDEPALTAGATASNNSTTSTTASAQVDTVMQEAS
ncbi:hypothetical protein BJV82DRAFT_521818 [Fennellomyces sp. T-0311]|nr:hypothetical protein BJV82DRAFT_521818 [Fennellomyces sp. T-0311]